MEFDIHILRTGKGKLYLARVAPVIESTYTAL
jgi:hypothetical protein